MAEVQHCGTFTFPLFRLPSETESCIIQPPTTSPFHGVEWSNFDENNLSAFREEKNFVFVHICNFVRYGSARSITSELTLDGGRTVSLQHESVYQFKAKEVFSAARPVVPQQFINVSFLAVPLTRPLHPKRQAN
jgi:hypothetical protein